jgi:hypothetical protein
MIGAREWALESSLPFCVRFHAAVVRRATTLDTGPVARAVTLAGFPLARQQTISSPHVH